MWYLEIDLTGRLGFADGYLEVAKGVLITPESDLTEAQKQKLKDSLLWSKRESEVPDVPRETSEEEAPKDKPAKKRKGRKASTKKA